jgi:pyruvate formate lyase activating enzyme
MNRHTHPGTGLVVDIHRFSLHDGPGIRTTVFLKGCHLSCTWCHNPEAIAHRPQLSFDPDKCTNCFRCVDACTSGAHSIVEGRHQVDFSKCTLSGACVEACPSEALVIIGKQMTAEEVLSVVLRDREYYEHSGGGVTISGGEPMTQFEFTKALLTACKAHGIHTTLDTCGHVPTERYREVLPVVDLFLYDYKETDGERHRHYTGVSNTLILQNLDMLHAAGAKVVLRCPIVPGVNDTVDHFRGIRDLSFRYPNLSGIELMPYHNMGVGKGHRVGRESRHDGLPTTGKTVSRQWVEELTSLGCCNVSAG